MENKKMQDDSIDLGKLANIALTHKKEVGGIIAGCTLLAAGISFVLPPKYESTTLVQMRSAGRDISGLSSMASMMGISIGSNSSAASPTNYIELMKSRRVLEPVIDSLEWKDEDKRPSAAVFAKNNIDIQNTKQTNLITIVGKGRTPEEAQKISQGVVDNFLLMQTDMNQQTQSLLVKFLTERIETAKQEADEAATKLAEYSKEHKMYAPEDQAKQAIEKLNVYDKAIGDMVVKQKASQAEYDTVTAQIGKQKANAKSYNINDNSTVVSIRQQIVSQELSLVLLEQKYTAEHPEIVNAKGKLDELHRELSNEVAAIVNSGTASINSAHTSMLTNQATAEAELNVAVASENALRAKKTEVEKEMGTLPDEVMNYMQLDSDAKLKQEVYLNLVKQCESDKIQEAMESMDIQVIDVADLPKGPAFPNKMLFSVIGFLLGTILSFYYCMMQYKQEDC